METDYEIDIRLAVEGIVSDRSDDITSAQDVGWYLAKYAEYHPLTENQWDEAYAQLITHYGF